MYSVVLLAAMTAGSASQDCCFSGLCNWGCGQGSYVGCYGTGYGTYGCGYGSYGCGYGGRYCGCYGGYFGSSGAYGAGYCGDYGGCIGISLGYSAMNSPPYQGSPYQQMQPMGPIAPQDPPIPQKGKIESLPLPKGGSSDLSRAKVLIDVPAQAKLYIDGQLMADKTGQRTFMTPALQPGQTYFYDVKIVRVQAGIEQVQTTRVVMRQGQVVAATFEAPTGSNGTAVVVAPRP